MTPDIGVRLRSVIRALEEVLLPAIAADNPLAREQAVLAMGHLRMLDGQWRYAADYARLNLDAMVDLGRDLLAAVEGGDQTRSAAAALERGIETDGAVDPAALHRLWMQNGTVSTAIDRLSRAASVDGSREFQATLDRHVLRHGLTQSMRDRGWFSAAGLDPDLPTLTPPAALVGAHA